jgi:hypothetical protein
LLSSFKVGILAIQADVTDVQLLYSPNQARSMMVTLSNPLDLFETVSDTSSSSERQEAKAASLLLPAIPLYGCHHRCGGHTSLPQPKQH